MKTKLPILFLFLLALPAFSGSITVIIQQQGNGSSSHDPMGALEPTVYWSTNATMQLNPIVNVADSPQTTTTTNGTIDPGNVGQFFPAPPAGYFVWLQCSVGTQIVSSQFLPVTQPGGTYIWTIQTGAASNCNYTLNIHNSGAFQQLFEVDRSNNPVAFILVNPGASVVYPVSDPYCQPDSWIYRRLVNGQISGGNLTNVPGGQIMLGGIVIDPNYDSGLNDITPTPSNPNPGGLNLNFGPGTTAQNNNGGPVPVPITPNNTNGPIVFGTNSTPTNALNNGVAENGFNSLYTATVNGDNAIIQAIHQESNGVSVNFTNTTIVTNTGGSNIVYTGVLGAIETNTGGILSNTLSSNIYSAATNLLHAFVDTNLAYFQTQGSNAGTSLSNSWGPVSALVGSAPSLTASGGSSLTVPIGFSQPPITISVAELPASFSGYRGVITWSLVIATLVAMIRYAETAIKECLSQRQIQGSSQEVLGVNLDAPIGVAYAAIAIGLIVTIPLAVVAFLSSFSSTGSNVIGDLTGMAGEPMYGIITSLIPVDVMVLAFFSYVTFRYVLVFPLALLARAIILFLIA